MLRTTIMAIKTPGWRRHRTVRQVMALVLVLLAALTALSSLRSTDPWGVVISRPVTAGTELGRDDLERRRIPASLLPPGGLTEIEAGVGRIIVVSADPGQILTETLLVGPELTARMIDGLDTDPRRGTPTLVPLRLSDSSVIPFLGHGDTVTVLVAEDTTPPDTGVRRGFRVIAEGARVVLAGDPTGKRAKDPATVLLALPEEDARMVASAALTAPVAVVLTGARAG
ncbi:SAF domain-containing protein [Corynebacterium sp. CCM 9203]|uniref:SAF domain-containing protein n=1 Tax=Corynebacterium sp. CCM 9203 TaxID=3057615 RepID=UPI003524553B